MPKYLRDQEKREIVPMIISYDTDQFKIRLNTVYVAVFTTTENFSIKVINELRSRLDDIIWENRSKDGISILYYTPEGHFYYMSQARAYLNKEVNVKNKRAAMMPMYGLSRHPIAEVERNDIYKRITEKYPNGQNSHLTDQAASDLQQLGGKGSDTLTINIDEGAFDILNYTDSTLELRYEEEPEAKQNFAFFFSWLLGSVELNVFDNFLEFHLGHNFENDVDKYIRFLKGICAKYQGRIVSSVRSELVNDWTTSLVNRQVTAIQAASAPDLEHINILRTSGRKPKDKIEIPKPKIRTQGDNLTRLVVEDTALLFDYLRELNATLSQELVSNQSTSKAIEALTGFSSKTIADLLGTNKYSSQSKRKVRQLLKDILSLIDKELGVKTPGSY